LSPARTSVSQPLQVTVAPRAARVRGLQTPS
jgi:hypothetical protein